MHRNSSIDENTHLLSHNYILYKRRWFMLAVVVMFNISNAMIWISFAPVTNLTASYFHISETTVNWFSLVYFLAFVPFCGLSWWTIETLGFRFSVILGSILNAVGAIIRIVGVQFFSNSSTKFIVVLTGQVLSASTQPLVLSMPTKLAALWFGDHERTLANTIASMANPLGVLLANAGSVALVTNPDEIKLMVVVFAIPAVIGALMAMLGFWSSKPPTPPSSSAMEEPVSFFVGIRAVLKNKQFLLLALAAGCGIGAFSALTTIIQQLICKQGYSDTIAGVCGAMVIVGGFIGAGLSGVYIDKTRNYITLAKPMVLFLTFSSAAVVIFTSIRNQPALVIISFTLFGLFGLGVLPVFLELGVECTYPVDEATSSGISWMTGQIVGAVMMIGSLAAAPHLSKSQVEHSTCVSANTSTLDPIDLTLPTIVMVIISSISALAFVIFFDTPYKRLNAEKIAELEESSPADERPINDRHTNVI